MYKILIVDDKFLIRKGIIKKIKWEELGVELVGEAEDGNEALKIIETKSPDIVITDMRMPESDGITLLNKIQQKSPWIKTIVISAYDDFEYARQAIKSGSIDYILKPIDSDELNSSIKKACGIIDKNRNTQETQNNDSKVKDYIYKLINGMTMNTTKGLDFFGCVDVINDFCCVAVLRNNNIGNYTDSSAAKLEGSYGFKKIYSLGDEKENIIVFFDKPTQNIDFIQTKIERTVENYVLKDLGECKGKIIGVGKVVTCISELVASYKEAKKALCYSIIDPDSKIFRYSESKDKVQIIIPIEEYEKELIINLTCGNVEKVKKILDIEWNKILSIQNIDMDSITIHMLNLCHILLKVNTRISDDIQKIINNFNNIDYLLSYRSINEINFELYKLYELTARKYIRESGGKQSVALSVKEFININYHNDIKLDEIAKLFHVSASYLSRVFKKEIGLNINEYITELRIEKAKQILRRGDVSINKLACMIGFSNHMYFHRVFKKLTGETPKEYQVKNLSK